MGAAVNWQCQSKGSDPQMADTTIRGSLPNASQPRPARRPSPGGLALPPGVGRGEYLHYTCANALLQSANAVSANAHMHSANALGANADVNAYLSTASP